MKRNIRSVFLPIFVVFVVAFIPSMTMAAIVGPLEAEKVADQWLDYVIDRYGSWGGTKQPAIAHTEEFKGWAGELLGYKFSIQPKGHILVSLLTQLPAVKSYSASYDFDVEASGGYPALLKDTMGATLDFIQDSYGPLDQLPEEGLAPAANQSSWDRLLRREPQQDTVSGDSSDYAPDWGPLVQSSWGQGEPYNDNCPTGDAGCATCPGGGSPTHPTLVGCVATAAAQIANYWKYPRYGSGSHTWNWPGDDSCNHSPTPQSLTVTFSDSYDWNNMLNSYSGSYTTAQAAAVAELSYEMAVAFDMRFGVCSSGSWTDMAQDVFPDYFKYANTIWKLEREDYTADAWFEAIKQEFDSYLPRPVQYRIKGHSIVCDGVREGMTQYMHMNYGWYGSANAWYAVDNLYCPWAGCSIWKEYAMVGIQPLNRMYTYVKGGGNSTIYVKYRTYTGYSQSVWETLPRSSTDCSPATAVYRNRQYMAVKASSGEGIYLNSRSGQFDWGAWTSIPGSTSTSPALAAYDDKLFMAVKGGSGSNGIYYRYMTSGGSWYGWYSLPGATNDSPVLAAFNDKLYLFVKGLGGGIYYKSRSSGGSWSAWKTLPGSTSHAPAVAVYYDRIYVAVKAAGGTAIYWGYLDTGETWHGWYNLPGGTDRSPNLMVMPQTGTMSLAVKGAGSDSIYYQGYTIIDSWAYSWTQIPGGTSDTPVQCTHYYDNPWEAASGGDAVGQIGAPEKSGPM